MTKVKVFIKISFSSTWSMLSLYIQHLLTLSKSSKRAANHKSTTKVSVTNCGSSYIPNPIPLTKATELVPILLRAGSNVNAQRTNDGFSALHVAAMVGRLEVANLLLQVFFFIIAFIKKQVVTVKNTSVTFLSFFSPLSLQF